MWYFKKSVISIITSLIMLLTIGCTAEAQTLKSDKYLITAVDGEIDPWGEYLYNHLSKRSEEADIVSIEKEYVKPEAREKVIIFELVSDLNHDYCISHTTEALHIKVKNRKTAIWMTYQLINAISIEDERINSTDLPPSVIDFNTKCKDFDFIYREPFYSSNLEVDFAPIIGTNSLDTDWGIWGHNLAKIIEYRGEDDIYALVNNKRNKDQFCFSSNSLFNQTMEYIIDVHGDSEDHSNYFMIMPKDNNLVCTCSSCLELGNSKNNATPAVYSMILKLAKRFPMHQFYTSAYLTTNTPPDQKMPENSGVFFSTIALPKGVKLDNQQEVTKVISQIEKWQSKTENIYLWDYTANFDDYLTPLPILLGLQAQLKYFKNKGIKGLFLNAGGYDYIPFDDLKTFVAAALMMDVESDITDLTTKFFKKKYPRSYKLLSNYYINLESNYYNRNIPYNLYGSMRENMETYFDVEIFMQFYNDLSSFLDNNSDNVNVVSEEEKYNLQKLLTALTYTRLQIAYTEGTTEWGYAHRAKSENNNRIDVNPDLSLLVDRLREHINYDNLQNYKEFDGSLSEYIAQWDNILEATSFSNKLLHSPLTIISKKDENFKTTEILTDGTPGFAIDYHQGWYLSSGDDLEILLPNNNIKDAKLLQLRFLSMERHGIYPPADIKLLIDNKTVQQGFNITYEGDKLNPRSVIYTLPVDLSDTSKVQIKIQRLDKSKSVLALDEVRLL